MRVGSVGIHDYVGVVRGRNLVILVHSFHVPATRGKIRVPEGRTSCEKKPGAHLSGVVSHKLWRDLFSKPVPQMPIHRGHSPRVLVVAQKLDGLVGLPGCYSGGLRYRPMPAPAARQKLRGMEQRAGGAPGRREKWPWTTIH